MWVCLHYKTIIIMSKKILVIGSSNTDMTVKSEKMPAPGETVLGGVFVMGPGGKGANQAVAAKRLGGDVSFVCKLGKDIFGDNAIEGYNREGIDTSHILRSDMASGVALILVDSNAENCIAVAPGANNDLSPEDIESLAGLIKEADYLILQLEIPIESVLKAAKIAHEAGVYVILNPAPACPLPEELFKYLSLITPNAGEVELLTGVSGELDEKVEALRKMGVEDVIITLGSKGSYVAAAEEPSVLVPALKVNAVDTTAAGDTFCGALCVAMSEGKSLKEAAEFATKASSLTVQKMGAQSSIPYRKDL